jgi:hypothetical protein
MGQISKQARKMMGGLFETKPPSVQTENAPIADKPIAGATESITSDPSSCPRCGRKSLVSTRPLEYGGRDRYCSQCHGDEAGEPLRWRSEEGTPF